MLSRRPAARRSRKLASQVVALRRQIAGGADVSKLARKKRVSRESLERLYRGDTYPDAGGPTGALRARLERDVYLPLTDVIEIQSRYDANEKIRTIATDFPQIGHPHVVYIGRRRGRYARMGLPLGAGRNHQDNYGKKIRGEYAVELCMLYATGQWTFKMLGEAFGISATMACRIWNGGAWGSATGR